MPDQTTPPVETPPADPPVPDVNEPVDDDQYQDVLYAALDKIYKSIDDEGGFLVDADTDTSDDGDADDKDGVGEKPPKPKAKSVDEMSLEELRDALKNQGRTLKEVVGLSLQEREERAALDTWNGFIKEATEVETAIAKSFGGMEVESKEDVERLITQVRAVAKATETVIDTKTKERESGAKKTLQKQYGILTPEPDDTKDSKAQDEKDLKEHNYRGLISRRFNSARANR